MARPLQTRRLRIGVIGGGIGGLAAALALSQRGFAVRVFEQSEALREVGAGVQMAPNATRVLRALGLEAPLHKIGFQPQAIVVRDWDDGREKRRTPLQDAGRRYGAAYYQVHRADLLEMIASALGDAQLELNARVAAVSSTPHGAAVTLDGGRQEAFDLVVGCDGIHSLVRRTLHGPQSPRFTGTMCWRALTPAEVFPSGFVAPEMTIWMGPLGHIVVYYVRGGRYVNMVAVRRSRAWVEESWSVPSSAPELSAAFPRVNADVRILLGRAQNAFKWGLFDRDPLPWWSRGRITLLGDAAHPMLPFLAQGAAMAIEDAFVLAQTLAGDDDVERALQRYEAARLPRTARVQLAARAQGEIFHLMSPFARLKRWFGLDRLAKPDPRLLDRDWLYEYDATACLPREA
ncbi:MAG: NAD(P)-binding protein [Pseudorhodoplanes sp.]|nr:MAG: NAD(P)-binding protein [Pseudorhodoplanes sp.]